MLFWLSNCAQQAEVARKWALVEFDHFPDQMVTKVGQVDEVLDQMATKNAESRTPQKSGSKSRVVTADLSEKGPRKHQLVGAPNESYF